MRGRRTGRDCDLTRQIDCLREYLSGNQVIREILRGAPSLAMANWYLGAGCIAQTVWNFLHDFEPAFGIKDYDLVYQRCIRPLARGAGALLAACWPAPRPPPRNGGSAEPGASTSLVPPALLPRNRALRISRGCNQQLADDGDLRGSHDRRYRNLARLRPVWVERPVQHDGPTQPDAGCERALRVEGRAVGRLVARTACVAVGLIWRVPQSGSASGFRQRSTTLLTRCRNGSGCDGNLGRTASTSALPVRRPWEVGAGAR